MVVKETTKYLIGRLWRDWLQSQFVRISGAVFFMVIVAATSALYPKVIELAVDMLADSDKRVITLLPAAIIIITFIRGIASYSQSVLNQSMSLRVIAELQKSMFSKLMYADMKMMQDTKTGNLISRFTNDVNLMRDALSRTLTVLGRELLTAIALIGMMFHLDWILAIIVVITLPLAGRPILRLGRRLRRASTNVQTSLGSLTSTLAQSFNGIRLIKAYGMEKQQNQQSEWLFDEVYRLIMKTLKGRARSQPILEILGGFCVALVLAYGGLRVISGSGTLGEFVGFLSAAIMLLQPIRSIGNFNASLQEGLAAVKRTFDLLDTKPEIIDHHQAKILNQAIGNVELIDVSFSYENNRPVLDKVSISVKEGQTIALVGPSGAGKSTILNLIPRFYDTDSGSVKIDGHDVKNIATASLRSQISIVSQDITLFNLSIADNIRFGDFSADLDKIQHVAKIAAAHDFIINLPDGYDTVVGERGTTLSGGERQRIAIARAMLRNAPILLFDEATSSLDAESEFLVHNAIKRLSEGRTTIVIAHRLSTVMAADKIYVMNEGKIVEHGKHKELIAKNGLYSRLAQIQFQYEKNS